MAKQTILNNRDIQHINNAIREHITTTNRRIKSEVNHEIVKIYQTNLLELNALQIKLNEGELAL